MPHQRFRNVNNPDNHRGATLGDRKGPSETRPEFSPHPQPFPGASPSRLSLGGNPLAGEHGSFTSCSGETPPPHWARQEELSDPPGTPSSWAASDPSGGLAGRGNGNSDGWGTAVLHMK